MIDAKRFACHLDQMRGGDSLETCPVDVAAEPSQVGAAGRRASMLKLFQPVHEGECEFSEGETPEDAAANLALKLRAAKVL